MTGRLTGPIKVTTKFWDVGLCLFSSGCQCLRDIEKVTMETRKQHFYLGRPLMESFIKSVTQRMLQPWGLRHLSQDRQLMSTLKGEVERNENIMVSRTSRECAWLRQRQAELWEGRREAQGGSRLVSGRVGLNFSSAMCTLCLSTGHLTSLSLTFLLWKVRGLP